MSVREGVIVGEEVVTKVRIAPFPHELKADLPDTRSSTTWYTAWGKRALDVTIVLALLPLWAPIYLVVAAILLLSQGRPIHYTAARPGRHCAPFAFMKFRTMRLGAEQDLRRLLQEDPSLVAEFGVYHKLRKDPRCTRVGALLRRTCLDELPQLICVLKGDMSLVGPRPPWRPEEYETFYGSLGPFVLQHRPGLTGLWQVSRRTPAPYERKVWLDMVYATRCSPVLDLKILVRTLPTVLRGHGAF